MREQVLSYLIEHAGYCYWNEYDTNLPSNLRHHKDSSNDLNDGESTPT